MKTRNFIYLLLLVLFSFSCQQDFDEETGIANESVTKSAILIPEGLTEGTVITTQFYSPSFEGNLLGLTASRQVSIYLPEAYFRCPEKRFPVIYFLHGMPAWDKMLMEATPFAIFSQISGLAEVDFPEEGFTHWLNQLIAESCMPEVIIVMPNTQSVFGPTLYVDSPTTGNIDSYIANDLVTFIDENLRTIAHFNWRAISGHCAGAYGAMSIAMRHPKVFRHVAGLSPAHFSEDHILTMAAMSIQEEAMWEQMGFPPGPTLYDPMSPYKFVTNSLHLVCQSWLPNPDNPPYYCDLPYTITDGQVSLIPELMEQINQQNLLAETKQFENNLRQLKTIYFDCGSNDELFMFPFNEMLDQQLTEMHIKHQFETFEGTHINHLYERLAIAWTHLAMQFPERD